MAIPRTSLAFLGACAVSLYGQQPAEKQAAPKIVFVCEHGSAKSIMAAAEFARLAKARGLDFLIVSRGTNPDSEIAPGVKQGLKTDGMDLGSMKPVMVSSSDLEAATRVITFGPNLTEWLPKTSPIPSKVLDWSATPSPSKDYTVARDYIRRQLAALLDDLGRTKNATTGTLAPRPD